MAKVSDVYASPWLKAEDLRGATVKVKIARAGLENVRQADGSQQDKIIVDFIGKQKRFILNKTQATALVQATGSDDTAEWTGHEVYLTTQVTPQGKPTIGVMAVPVEQDGDDSPF